MLARLLLAPVLVLSLVMPALAESTSRPDDTVSFDLSAEDWVTTKTAHVTLGVEAAVTAAEAGAARVAMTKTVNDTAKADWRLVGFSRNQDQTGMERWSASFDTRLPESALNGLAESAKKASKPGMQISVASIDFMPTLDETEAVRTALRMRIFKQANEELTSLNSTLSGRGYRIAQISFDSEASTPLRAYRKAMPMAAMVDSSAAGSGTEPEHSQKLMMVGHVVYAALPNAPSSTR